MTERERNTADVFIVDDIHPRPGPASYIENAGRTLQAILAARQPEHAWSVEVCRDDDERHPVAASHSEARTTSAGRGGANDGGGS